MFEQAPKPNIEKEEVVKSLKENPENLELLKTWYQQNLEKIEIISSKEACAKARIEFVLEYAKVLQEVNFLEESWETLNDSLDDAKAFGEEDLLQKMKDLMEELEKGGAD